MKERSPITKNLIGVGGGAILGNDTHDFEQTTTQDAYGQVGDVFAKEGLLTTRIQIRNIGGGGNIVACRIMGSLDGGKTFPAVAVSEFPVNDGEDTMLTITDYYTHLKLEAKSQSAGSSTEVIGQAAAVAR